MDNTDSILSEIKPPEVEVTFFQGFLTRLIDFVIDMFFLIIIYLLIPRELLYDISKGVSFIGLSIILVVVTVYRIIFLMLFNKTIGMMICSVKFLNKNLQPLSPKEKILSIFRTRFSGIKYYKDK